MDAPLTTASGLAGMGGLLVVVNTIIVPLRFYARRKQGAAIKVDDLLVVASYVFFVAAAACTWFGIKHRFMGYPTPADPDVVLDTLEELEKLYLIFDVFAVLTLGLSKLSALFFYRRIFCLTHRREIFGYATIISIIIVALWIITFAILTFFECGTHISAMWTPAIRLKYCTLDYPILEGLAISDFLLDLWILLLPIPKILALHATTRRKLAILGVFFLALVGFAACVVRMVMLIKLLFLGEEVNFDENDPYLIDTEATFLYVLEAGMVLVAVNLPSLWHFHSQVKPESILRSIRSFASLTSQRSSTTRSNASLGGEQWRENQRSFSKLSKTELAFRTGPEIETRSLVKSPSERVSEAEVKPGEIKVTNSVDQTEDFH